METLEPGSAEGGASRRPARIKKIGQLIPLLGVWLLVAVIFGSFVFYQITDTDPAHKLTLYVDGEVRNEAQLAALLEKELPEPIRMVQVHPFSYAGEDRYFRGGAGPVRYEMSGIPFTTMICYDLRFPEEFREVAGDVHAAVIPANWPASRSEHWKTLLRARAIENQIYIFAVNCVGTMDGQEYSGDSCVICPDGRVADMLSGKAGVLRYRFTDDTVSKHS